MHIPLSEFDDGEGLIAPSPPQTTEALPHAAVLCFFPEVLSDWEFNGRLRVVGAFSDEVGGARIYVHESDDSSPVAVFHPGMDGPLASHCVEKVIAAGVKRVLAVGGAGSLSEDFLHDNVLVVSSAIRDEGTSFHYMPPSREVTLDPWLTTQAVATLAELNIPYRVGKTWTTDADFRETQKKIASRLGEGCVAVEMEAASLAAVCAFRGVRYAQMVYSGDALHGSTWQSRDWSTSGRRSQLLEIAVGLVTEGPDD